MGRRQGPASTGLEFQKQRRGETAFEDRKAGQVLKLKPSGPEAGYTEGHPGGTRERIGGRLKNPDTKERL